VRAVGIATRHPAVREAGSVSGLGFGTKPRTPATHGCGSRPLGGVADGPAGAALHRPVTVRWLG
jgi:hypothetical protein